MWAGKKWLKLCRDGRKFRTLDASSDTVIKISPMQGRRRGETHNGRSKKAISTSDSFPFQPLTKSP